MRVSSGRDGERRERKWGGACAVSLCVTPGRRVIRDPCHALVPRRASANLFRGCCFFFR